VLYTGGDQCFYSKSDRNFTSEVRFICDHKEEQGWPQVVRSLNQESANPCHILFDWRSKYACRQCLRYEVTEVSGACNWNKREITQQPNEQCYIYVQDFVDQASAQIPNANALFSEQDFAFKSSWVESCSPVQDFMRNQTVVQVLVLLFTILALLLLVCFVAVYRYRRIKYQYYEKVSLLRGRDGNRMTEDRSQEMGDQDSKKKKGKRQIIYKIGDEE